MHMHDMGSDMATEHMQLMDLVERSEATHVAIAHGDWFDPATWHEGRIPDAGAQVLIPHGIHVNYDGESDASLFTVRVDGQLAFATDADTRMEVDTFVVAPSGRLEIGTADTPVQANVNTEIIIANNGDIDVNWDPTLLSRGLISHGEVEIHGAEKTTFLKVDDAPMAGDTQITLEEVPEGWQVGDTIVITGTHKQGWTWDNDVRRVVHRESEDEEVTITAINGTQITIDRPLEHDHDTPREDLAAYVSNMSRNITVRSEDGEGTEVHHRGHVMFMHSDDVDVRYAAFDDLGRTDKSFAAADVGTFSTIEADSNVKGRYAVHLHRTGTEDQESPSFLVGNAVSGSPGWGIAHHSSHSVIVDNAVFDAFGAAFAAEDGDETGVWGGNIAIRSEGIGYGDWTAKDQNDVQRHDNGRTGDGFFFAGRLVEANDNVAANTTHGYVWMHRSAPAAALSDNLDQPEVAYGAGTIRPDLAPIQGFDDNEAFGTQVGLIVVKANHRQEHEVRTVMDGFLNWETSAGVNLSYTSHYTVKNIDLIGTENREEPANAEYGVRLGNNAYDMVVNGAAIDGFATGVDVSTNGYTLPITTADAQNFFIDVEVTDTNREYIGLDESRHQIMSSDELVQDRLDFTMGGDLTLSQGETLFFDGVKTDSIGSRDRQFSSMDEFQAAYFYENIVPLLQNEGYYTAPDGRHILLVEDFVADRATGELLKFAHRVTLQMSDSQLAAWGAVNNGPIDLTSSAPIARNDTATVAPGQAVLIDVLANDNDPEGDAIRIDGMTQPDQGGAQMGPDGTILFFGGLNSEGTETFTYWVTDNAGNYTPAEVTVTIDPTASPTPQPDPDPQTNVDPDAVDEAVTTDEDQAITINVLSNDQDPDGDPLVVTSVGTAANGMTTINANGTITYTPDPGFNGNDSFTYTVSDGQGGTDSATVSISVSEGNSPINGSNLNDTLNGTSASDIIDGFGGNDLVYGGLGFDSIVGAEGNDTLFGEVGFDTLEGGVGDDELHGGDQADLLRGGAGADSLIGGEGADHLHGETGNDTLLGGSGADRFFGGDGADWIDAGSNFGNSVDGVEGGAGNDTIFGGIGFDLLQGGDDDDEIDGGDQADNLYGEDGNDTLNGGNGFDRLFGGEGDDLLEDFEGFGGQFGGGGNDTMRGGDDNTNFFGQLGNDLIEAGGGDDRIGGNAGFDIIDGGAGNDLMFGDFNADTFVFQNGHGVDTIGDFDALNTFERIDLSAVSTITSLADLDLGSASTGAATQMGADVEIDTGGGNLIILNNVSIGDLDATDFLF
ncbi:Bifunctional hemolysin/adenylate cyclase precursor [Roseovarius sp. THAF9]|nr:Bifunctional hemolysin/adenylate cyclase precursor [Roseovarius sp. THAF9]